jgi:drug/metabolite transporter (DMT)-like permease
MLLGILVYSVTQGAQFLSLAYLPAVTTSLFLSFSPIIVAILAYPLLNEQLTLRQWGGAGFYLLGLFVYFYPLGLPGHELIGLGVAVVGVLANALSAILGRHVNQQSELDSTTVTIISMGVGSVTLLIVGTLVQGVPQLTLTHWGMILWLAVVNSAFAFTLWNHTVRTLHAVESSIINNTMLFQTALLAWLFLGEPLTWRQGVGMVLAALGTIIVQLRRPN